MFSDLDGKPKFKEASYKIRFATSSLAWNFYRKLKLLGFTSLSFASHICSTDSIPWVHHSREEGSLDYDGRLVRLQV
jgi:hypothetical protein